MKNCFGALAIIAMFTSSASADLAVNITGVAGSGFTNWTFVTVSSATTSADDSIRDPGAAGWTTGDSMQFGSSNGILDDTIVDQVFTFTGTASITIGGTTESIAAVFLDDDGTGAGDDLGIRTANELVYLSGETATWTGSGTVNVDINQLVEGSFNMDFGALWAIDQGNSVVTISAIPEPGSLFLIGLGAVGLIARRRVNS